MTEPTYIIIDMERVPRIYSKQDEIVGRDATTTTTTTLSQALWETSTVLLSDYATPLLPSMITTSSASQSPTMVLVYRLYQHRNYWTPLVKWSLKSLWNRTIQ